MAASNGVPELSRNPSGWVPSRRSSELELTVPLQVLSEGTEVPEVPPTVPDTAPVPEEERDLEEISLGSRPSQGPFSGGQE